MKFTDEGLFLSKAEIDALLAFASDNPESPTLYGVHFRVTRHEVRARASNGYIALDGLGQNESERLSEWFVHRDFLRRAYKVLDNSHRLRLEFKGASLYHSTIVDADGNELSSFSWPTDAANGQQSFIDQAAWDKLLKPPRGERQVSCIRLNADYLSLMKKIASAAENDGIDCYPPADAEEKSLFRCKGEDTLWLAAIAPMRVDDEPTVEGVARKFKEDLQDMADRTGTTVSMKFGDGDHQVLAKPEGASGDESGSAAATGKTSKAKAKASKKTAKRSSAPAKTAKTGRKKK